MKQGWILYYCMMAVIATAQPSASDDIDLTGVWLTDSSFAREYMLKSREMQVRWCGFGWSDSEIERRLQATKDFFLRYEFSKVARGTFSMKTFNEVGYVKTEGLSCFIRSDQRIECKRTSGDNWYFRLEKGYLYSDLLVHKSAMKCPGSKEPPEETQWLALFRMTRQK